MIVETTAQRQVTAAGTAPFLTMDADDMSLSYCVEYLKRRYAPDCVVYGIRGSKCSTLPALFDEWAAALQFPFYFGDNMNAFADCMADLWRNRPATHIIVVADASRLLQNDPDSLPEFFDVVAQAETSWKRRHQHDVSYRLKLILHEHADKIAALRQTLQRFQVSADELRADWLSLLSESEPEAPSAG